MPGHIVHVAVVSGLVSSLQELETLGTLRKLLETQSSLNKPMIGLKQIDKSEWLTIPSTVIDLKILRQATDDRISQVVAFIKEQYKFDPNDAGITMNTK